MLYHLQTAAIVL